MKGRLFVISAPSGTGKTTIIKNLMKTLPEAVLSVSVTTRRPRPGETDGVDYHFISEAEFQKMLKDGRLLEHAKVHNSYYGTPRTPIEKWLNDDKIILLDIDVQGAHNVKKVFQDAVLIFLLPPSREELIRRLKSRGTNAGADLDLRIKDAEVELSEKDFYDYHVVNDNMDKAVQEIVGIINKTCSV